MGILKLSKKDFKEAMEVLNAVAKCDTRPILQGVLFNAVGDVVALDGYRLMIRNFKSTIDNNYVVDAKYLKEILKAINKDTKIIQLEFKENTLVASINDMHFKDYTYMEGKFVNYKSLLPANNSIEVTAEAKELYNSIKSIKKSNKIIKLDIKDENINIKDEVSLNENVECKNTGDITIAVNGTYLNDIIKNYKDNVIMSFNNNVSPIIFTNNDNKIDLLLPVRLIKQ